MEGIFRALAQNGGLTYFNRFDLDRYSKEKDGKELIVHVKEKAKTGEKMRMYAFYHGPLLDCAIIGYANAGYSGIDKVKADYLLRANFAKDFIQKPDGEYEPIMLDKKDMSKDRLRKFIEDCILFIEEEFKQQVPDSSEYLYKKKTDKNYKSIK